MVARRSSRVKIQARRSFISSAPIDSTQNAEKSVKNAAINNAQQNNGSESCVRTLVAGSSCVESRESADCAGVSETRQSPEKYVSSPDLKLSTQHPAIDRDSSTTHHHMKPDESSAVVPCLLCRHTCPPGNSSCYTRKVTYSQESLSAIASRLLLIEESQLLTEFSGNGSGGVFCGACADNLELHDRLMREIFVKKRRMNILCGRLRQIYADARLHCRNGLTDSKNNCNLSEMNQVHRASSRIISVNSNNTREADKVLSPTPTSDLKDLDKFNCRVVLKKVDIVKDYDEAMCGTVILNSESSSFIKKRKISDDQNKQEDGGNKSDVTTPTVEAPAIRGPPPLKLMVTSSICSSRSSKTVSTLSTTTPSWSAELCQGVVQRPVIAALKTLRPKPMLFDGHLRAPVSCVPGTVIPSAQNSSVLLPSSCGTGSVILVPPSNCCASNVAVNASSAFTVSPSNANAINGRKAPLTVFRLPDGRLLMPAASICSSGTNADTINSYVSVVSTNTSTTLSSRGGSKRPVVVTQLSQIDVRNLSHAAGSSRPVERAFDQSVVHYNKILASLLQQKKSRNVRRARPSSAATRSSNGRPSSPRSRPARPRRRPPTTVDVEPCPLCSLHFGSRDEVDEHVRCHPLTCNVCQRQCNSRLELFEHRRSCCVPSSSYTPASSVLPTPDNRGGDYMCDRCGATFNRISQANGHALVFHQLSYRCPLCGQQDINLSDYEEHLRAVHGVSTPYPCNMCQTSFVRLSLLVSHFAMHHSTARLCLQPSDASLSVKIVSVQSEVNPPQQTLPVGGHVLHPVSRQSDDSSEATSVDTAVDSGCSIKQEAAASDSLECFASDQTQADSPSQHMITVKDEVVEFSHSI